MTVPDRPPRIGLILTGGGARAAYQVGVLKAVTELLERPSRNPFPILCGTSAGAINAGALAAYCHDFTASVDYLLSVWQGFRAHHVYRTDPAAIMRTGARWLGAMMLLYRRNPISLLDNAPLEKLLRDRVDFERIGRNIERGALHAVSVTASGYSSGYSVSFFQAAAGVGEWRRTQRIGAATQLGVDHLMASSALPFIFPARRLRREYFGDGSMRQIAPISPALHLGADRVLVIGTGRQTPNGNQLAQRARSRVYPTMAQIAGHALNSIFLDTLAQDIEWLRQINRAIGLVSPGSPERAQLPFRHVEVLVMQPSEPIERIAIRHVNELPRTIRFLLRTVGAMNRQGSNLASYLLFERGFCGALIELGYRDTLARSDEMLAFLKTA